MLIEFSIFFCNSPICSFTTNCKYATTLVLLNPTNNEVSCYCARPWNVFSRIRSWGIYKSPWWFTVIFFSYYEQMHMYPNGYSFPLVCVSSLNVSNMLPCWKLPHLYNRIPKKFIRILKHKRDYIFFSLKKKLRWSFVSSNLVHENNVLE